jgi:8-oxo-dGTP diphosphatase
VTAPICAVAVVRDEDDAVLLQLRDDDPSIMHPNMWVFPGGHGRNGEDPSECARRELREETAYDAPDLVHLGAMRDPEEVVTAPLHLYLTHYDGRQKIECLEGADMRWVTRPQADELDIPRFLVDAWDTLVRDHLSDAKTTGGLTT